MKSMKKIVACTLIFLAISFNLSAEDEVKTQSESVSFDSVPNLFNDERSIIMQMSQDKLIIEDYQSENQGYEILNTETWKTEALDREFFMSCFSHVTEERYFYQISYNPKPLDGMLQCRKYDLQTKTWEEPVVIRGSFADGHAIRKHVDYEGEEVFYSYLFSSKIRPIGLAEDENTLKLKKGAAEYLCVFSRANMRTGELHDLVTWCIGEKGSPDITTLCFDSFRHKFLRFNKENRTLLIDDRNGSSYTTRDLSAYFQRNETLHAKAFKDGILIFGRNKYILLNEEFTVIGKIIDEKYSEPLKTECEEINGISRLTNGCYYVRRASAGGVVLKFNNKANPITWLGWIRRDTRPTKGTFYWTSKWGDLLKYSVENDRIEEMQERYFGEDYEDKPYISGDFLFLPSQCGKKVFAYSLKNAELKKILSYPDNPVIDLSISSNSPTEIGLLHADGTFELINSISLEVKSTALLKEVVGREGAYWVINISRSQILLHYVVEGGYTALISYRYDIQGKLIEKIDRPITSSRGFFEFYNDRTKIFTPSLYQPDWSTEKYLFISGGYFWDYTTDLREDMVFTQISLETGKKAQFRFPRFKIPEDCYHTLLMEKLEFSYPYILIETDGIGERRGPDFWVFNIENGMKTEVQLAGYGNDYPYALGIFPLTNGRFACLFTYQSKLHVINPKGN